MPARSSCRSAAAGSRPASRSRSARSARGPGSSASRRAGTVRRSPTGSPSSTRASSCCALLDDLLDDRVDVSDDEIADAITLLLERAKLVVEGAGAATVAALLSGKAGGEGGVCALLSGGNIDPTLLISVMRHGLALAGRYLIVRTLIDDRPGALVELLQLVAAERGNVLSVEHHREGTDVHVAQTGVELTVITRNEEHCGRLCSALEGRGYVLDRLA